MNNDVLRVEQRDAVAWVTLNRPDVHNAFNETLITAITEAFARIREADSVRVVVVSGEGRSFSAGADLAWMGRMVGFSEEENLQDARTAQRMFAAVAECPKVTIARIHGAAMGGGAGLAACCDIAVAAESVQFAFSEVRLGIIPGIIAPFVLQKLSMGAARALFVTGQRFGAAEALRLGLVQEVVSDNELDAAIDRTIADALQAGPQAVARAKHLLAAIDGKTPQEAAEETVAAIANARVSAEGQEGIHAFQEKRKPGWVPT